MREMIIETRTIKNILEKLRFNCCNIFLRIDFYSNYQKSCSKTGAEWRKFDPKNAIFLDADGSC